MIEPNNLLDKWRKEAEALEQQAATEFSQGKRKRPANLRLRAEELRTAIKILSEEIDA